MESEATASAPAPWPWRLIAQAVLAAVIGPILLVAAATSGSGGGNLLLYAGIALYVITILESALRALRSSPGRVAIWVATIAAAATLMVLHVLDMNAEYDQRPEWLIMPAVIFSLLIVAALVAAILWPRERLMLPLVINLVVGAAYVICIIWFVRIFAAAKN